MAFYLWRKECAVATDTLLELLERIRTNDYQAFEQLFEAHWRTLYRYAYKVLRHAPDAEDITQELFCDLWANRTQLHVQTNAQSYLLGALRKKILTRFRDADIRSRHLQHFGAAQEISTELTLRHLVSHDTLAAVQARAQALPPKEKEVFLLSMLHDFSVKEIAERFATSEQTVRNQMNSALHKLSPYLVKLLS
ncbi:RNA polymerase sigma factor [Hymenobacter profundi]|uniref:Sigma-70 family RNA polymerase sigma factor n=1 Tax=Hymenobacter profundi TaxID=1982110 RepID=A0ABS6X504_9BACT|nr:sigma-70 family RNA polymerase sigma factor [Hymenobacter profundi]MBW3130911.1 sigma-70 family RNA polymerase sigma factor [Hymenobacter profundi]